MNIPIIVVCYNNYKYVQNTLAQIKRINLAYYANIQILDNCSTCLETIQFLNNVDVHVLRNLHNNGPWIYPYVNSHIYDRLPDKYIVTDPDLQFHEQIPSNCIEILSGLSDKYATSKIGVALDISDFEKMYPNQYHIGTTIHEWETQFWEKRLDDPDYILYEATIDTTFCLVNKLHFAKNYSLRIAGTFLSKHLPWYIENPIYNVYENYINNLHSTKISTISKTIVPYIERKYLQIYKQNEMFLIENDSTNPNLSFWKDIYGGWEKETFEIMDRYLSNEKIFLDIGGWIGTTSMYGSRKSKHVFTVEADPQSNRDLMANMRTNCRNYTCVPKVFYNVANTFVPFGKNKFLGGSKLNDSTSQIYFEGEPSDDCILVETITLDQILQQYSIAFADIGLIKVDIEGGEEHILNDVIAFRDTHSIPIYVSFHYSWWKDTNLDRFACLTPAQKNTIRAEPFVSILFT